MQFNFTRKTLRVLLRVLRAPTERVQFDGCVAEPLQTITAIFFGPKWICFLRIVLQDTLIEVTKICPPLRLRVFVDDITSFMNGRNKELVEMAEKVHPENGGRGERT